MQNYFNYFTEVEERFQQRRGSLLLLSTLDWTLIESWRDAEIPLEAVLRGIDDAFDKYEARKSKGKVRRVNGLAWCQQAVMEAAEQMREAATGTVTDTAAAGSGLEIDRIAAHLVRTAADLEAATCASPEAQSLVDATAKRLHEIAPTVRSGEVTTENLEHTLRTLEQKLLAMLMATAPEEDLSALRAQAAREIAPHRSRMQALQIRQIEQQFLEKRLLERYAVPRMSLFYMRDDSA